MIRIDTTLVEQFGGEAAMQKRVADFIVAREAHRFTVDQPAPIEHPLIEAIVAQGGWDAVVVEQPPPVVAGAAADPIPWGAPLGHVKNVALAWVDKAAEAERQKYVTPGAGQALEYRATEDEARRWQPGETLAGYPFLAAEADAMESALGVRPADADVVATVIAQADAWVSVGSRIKRLRREAKMRIEAAATEDEVRAAVNVSWEPPAAPVQDAPSAPAVPGEPGSDGA